MGIDGKNGGRKREEHGGVRIIEGTVVSERDVEV